MCDSRDHRTRSGAIHYQLFGQIQVTGRGQVFHAPTGVRLSDQDVFEPDLFVVLAERLQILKQTHVDGAPDLVVEILSEGTGRQDRGIKMRRYEAFGVREYWIVDPVKTTVEQFWLDSGSYLLTGQHSEVICLKILSDVAVDLGKVWWGRLIPCSGAVGKPRPHRRTAG